MSPIGHQNALDYLDANFCHVRPSARIAQLIGGKARREAAAAGKR